jgi:hypothetical protein
MNKEINHMIVDQTSGKQFAFDLFYSDTGYSMFVVNFNDKKIDSFKERMIEHYKKLDTTVHTITFIANRESNISDLGINLYNLFDDLDYTAGPIALILLTLINENKEFDDAIYSELLTVIKKNKTKDINSIPYECKSNAILAPYLSKIELVCSNGSLNYLFVGDIDEELFFENKTTINIDPDGYRPDIQLMVVLSRLCSFHSLDCREKKKLIILNDVLKFMPDNETSSKFFEILYRYTRANHGAIITTEEPNVISLNKNLSNALINNSPHQLASKSDYSAICKDDSLMRLAGLIKDNATIIKTNGHLYPIQIN